MLIFLGLDVARVENLSDKTDRNTTSQMERRTERGEEREVVILPVLAWVGRTELLDAYGVIIKGSLGPCCLDPLSLDF